MMGVCVINELHMATPTPEEQGVGEGGTWRRTRVGEKDNNNSSRYATLGLETCHLVQDRGYACLTRGGGRRETEEGTKGGRDV